MPRKYNPRPKKTGIEKKKLSLKIILPEQVCESYLKSIQFQNLTHNFILHCINKKIPTGQGCKPVLTKEQSEELKKCIVELAEMGFAPSVKDVRDIVVSYVQYNELADAKMRLQYKAKCSTSTPKIGKC